MFDPTPAQTQGFRSSLSVSITKPYTSFGDPMSAHSKETLMLFIPLAGRCPEAF